MCVNCHRPRGPVERGFEVAVVLVGVAIVLWLVWAIGMAVCGTFGTHYVGTGHAFGPRASVLVHLTIGAGTIAGVCAVLAVFGLISMIIEAD